jgi:autotransporter-associated beta strand protein
MNHTMKSKIKTVIFILFVATGQLLFAGSATWNLNPTSGDWNTATNWTPRTVPNGPNDTATFAVSNRTSVSVSGGNTEVDGVVFNPGASPFTITAYPGTLALLGVGITNNSSVSQNFVASLPDTESITFHNQATAGSETVFIAELTGEIGFYDEATAGFSTFTVQGSQYFEDGSVSLVTFHNASTAGNGIFTNTGGSGREGDGGVTAFYDNSTAADGTFTNTAATTFEAYTGGRTSFYDSSTAANAFIANEGGVAAGDPEDGGQVQFFEVASAGSATLLANGGSQGGEGGRITFWQTSDGGEARVELFGNGTLDITNLTSVGLTIGSLEGNGIVSLGPKSLTIGTNDLSTVFGGVVRDSGAVIKVGSGTLTLSGANTYAGGTTVSVSLESVIGLAQLRVQEPCS